MVRVLVADDEDLVRATVREALEIAGFEVAEAANGALAIAEQSRSPAKVLVVDIIMPEKEGVETIIQMRKQFPDLKIIAMSGGGRVGNVDFLKAAMTYGADRVIQKPFRMAEIVKLVREVLA